MKQLITAATLVGALFSASSSAWERVTFEPDPMTDEQGFALVYEDPHGRDKWMSMGCSRIDGSLGWQIISFGDFSFIGQYRNTGGPKGMLIRRGKSQALPSDRWRTREHDGSVIEKAYLTTAEFRLELEMMGVENIIQATAYDGERFLISLPIVTAEDIDWLFAQCNLNE